MKAIQGKEVIKKKCLNKVTCDTFCSHNGTFNLKYNIGKSNNSPKVQFCKWKDIRLNKINCSDT